MIRKRLARRRFVREHRFTQDHMSQYVDGELAVEERSRVEEHVGVCPQCRRVFATLKRTMESLRGLASEPRPALSDGIIDRLRHP
jgi:anti-sigma factor RsiW